MDAEAERDVERIHLIKRTIEYSVDRLRNCRQQLPARPPAPLHPDEFFRIDELVMDTL